MEEEPLFNALVRQPIRKITAMAVSVVGLLLSGMALAEPTLKDPQPFEAQYRLEVRGWPGANITHRLSNEGSHWLTDMRFSVRVARGQEFSRFSLNDDVTHSLLYSSSYSLLGVGDSYSLNEGDISTLDRQTALFDLSRRAGHENCTKSAPCEIQFVDHKGRDEHFQYYVDKQHVSDPASIGMIGDEFEALNVSLIDVEKPDRLLQLRFHPDWPGLVLSVVYQKEGSRETQLTLTNFNPVGGTTP